VTTAPKTLAAAALAACTLAATAGPATASPILRCGRQTEAIACISNEQHVTTLFAVPAAETAALHVANVAAYVVVYRVPNSSVGIPCVVASVDATASDECASLGLVRDESAPPVALVDGPVDGFAPAISPTPLATVDVCSGLLHAGYQGIGLDGQPIVIVCLTGPVST
jgi:hypothetical protein